MYGFRYSRSVHLLTELGELNHPRGAKANKTNLAQEPQKNWGANKVKSTGLTASVQQRDSAIVGEQEVHKVTH